MDRFLAIVMFSAVTMVTVFSGGCMGCDKGYSDGDRTGVITKFSNKGIMWKSWEGQLNLGGMVKNSDDQMVPNVWEFTVTDEAIVPQVQAAQAAGHPVTLHYTQWLLNPVWIDSQYEITSVK